MPVDSGGSVGGRLGAQVARLPHRRLVVSEVSGTQTLGGLSRAFDLIVLGLTLTLLQLSSPLGEYIPGSRVLVLFPLWLVILKNLFLVPAMSLSFERALGSQVSALRTRVTIPWLLAFSLLLVVILFRGMLNGAYSFTNFIGSSFSLFTLIVFGAALYLPPASEEHLRRIGTTILWGCCIYVIANVLLYAVGVRNPSVIWTPGGSSTLLGLIGISSPRILFPLASGVNNFGSVAGASAVAAAWLVLYSRSWWARTFAFVAGTASVFAIFACDSRAALVFATVAVLACIVAPRRIRLRSAVLLVLAPLAVMMLAMIADSFPTDVTTDVLARRHSFDPGYAVTTGRTVIWNAAFRELADVKLIHLVGFGYFGHVVSGISKEYATVFGEGGVSFFSLHNGLLQYVVDSGYLGAALFLVVSIVALRFLRGLDHRRAPEAIALIALLFYFFFVASVDAVPTLYTPDGFRMYYLILVYAAFRPLVPIDAAAPARASGKQRSSARNSRTSA